MVYTKNRFEWDLRKAQLNLKKHGLSFEIALTAFDDPAAIIKDDPKHSRDEIRAALIGQSDNGVIFIVFTIREPNGVFRIISARRANRKERKLYEESK